MKTYIAYTYMCTPIPWLIRDSEQISFTGLTYSFGELLANIYEMQSDWTF